MGYRTRNFLQICSPLAAIMLHLTASIGSADVYSDCGQAVAANDAAKARSFAETMLRFKNITSPGSQIAGVDCISFAMGEPYIYSLTLGRFAKQADETTAISENAKADEENAKLRAKAEEDRMAERVRQTLNAARAERVIKAREDKVWRKVVEACNGLYLRDESAAVTNRICLDVFLTTGLPE